MSGAVIFSENRAFFWAPDFHLCGLFIFGRIGERRYSHERLGLI